MIKIKRLNGEMLVINSDLVETIEQTPDTVITLTNGKKLVALDSIDDIIERVIKFKSEILKSSFSDRQDINKAEERL